MKARIIYLATFVMAMVACSSEDELNVNDNFPEMSEEFLERNITIIDLPNNLEKSPILEYQKWMNDSFRSNYECFYSMDEVAKSPYSSTINFLPEIAWDKQTLIIVYVHYINQLDYIHCNIYRKQNKYYIDCMTEMSFMTLMESKGVAIVVEQANLRKENIKFNLRLKEE